MSVQGGSSAKKEVTKTVELSFRSDERRLKRQQFEQKLKEKEAKLVLEKEQLELERQAQEEQEIREIRAKQCFKATPIKHYRFTSSTANEATPKQLTVPRAPSLATD